MGRIAFGVALLFAGFVGPCLSQAGDKRGVEEVYRPRPPVYIDVRSLFHVVTCISRNQGFPGLLPSANQRGAGASMAGCGVA